MDEPALDEAALRTLIGALERGRVADILRLFEDEAAARLARLGAAGPDDFARIEHEAHALKGSAATFGAPALAAAARRLEEAAEAKDAAACALLLTGTEAALGAMRQALAAFTARLKEEG
ncbi:MAG: Hpt domain-containing protein [Proteobacteria bacterium]|nr:Hpt domain-containing protein [Pseudomonadota bacterium]